MDLRDLKINLKALKDGLTKLSFDLDDTYFASFEADEVRGGCVHVDIDITCVKEDFFSIEVHEKGNVVISCDICLDSMNQSIEVKEHLDITFGDKTSEEDSLIVVNDKNGIFDFTWILYELLVLDIPIRHVHAKGECNPVMVKKLEEYSSVCNDKKTDRSIDPRWESLLKLKK